MIREREVLSNLEKKSKIDLDYEVEQQLGLIILCEFLRGRLKAPLANSLFVFYDILSSEPFRIAFLK